jgi:hypothetical protein
MSLPLVGTTVGVQGANQSVAATASAAGGITFVGPSGIQGSTITCVVTVPTAPVSAIFIATLGTPGGQGVIVGAWGGGSTAGQFQIGVGQTLVITGTGLTGATAYTCTFGITTDIGDVQSIIPSPNSTALSAAISGSVSGVFQQVFSGSVALGGSGQVLIPNMPGSFQSFLVVVTNALLGTVYWTVAATNFSAGNAAFPGGQFGITPGGAGTAFSGSVNCTVSAGQTLELSFNQVATTITLAVYGNSNPRGVVPVPGVPLDVVTYGGLQVVSLTTAAIGTTPLLPAPAAGFAYRLHSFASNSTAGGQLFDTTTTNTLFAVLAANPGQQQLNGQLVTVALSLYSAGAGGSKWTLTYDVVTLPSIT